MTAKTLFGTDGVRGLANVSLTPEMVLRLARAAAAGLSGIAVIGRDTRRSGQMLAAALQAGFHSAGLDTLDAGIIPVGGLSYLTAERRAAVGAMVSASHNPAADNGIKFLGRDGAKLDDGHEVAIEARYRESGTGIELSGDDLGIATEIPDAVDLYVGHLVQQAEFSLNGLQVALDCANGAAFAAAPRLFERLGAEVELHAAEPSGMNINEGCGATHPEFLASRAEGMIGLAFDGDADRLIAVDEDGFTCDGDVIMAILARHLRGRDALPGDTVVTTVMSNLGFRVALRKMGITLLETEVGDRYVLEKMRASGAGLGGEQSGHVIIGNRPAGDGLLTAVKLLEVVAATGSPLKELRRVMVAYPQVLRNVRVRVRERLPDADAVWAAVEKLEKRLGDDGRILVRASGTEPVVRVMVEASAAADAAATADELAMMVRKELGASPTESG
jgi:phosphoglucosamine mutase